MYKIVTDMLLIMLTRQKNVKANPSREHLGYNHSLLIIKRLSIDLLFTRQRVVWKWSVDRRVHW